nr:neutral/alkaline non-lysosomal ceramidase N-terminal domain-containing protein [Pedosphaera parvula]
MSKCLCHRAIWLILLSFVIALQATGLPAETSRTTAPAPKKQLRAGAATSNITPKLGVSINGNFHDTKATHVHDELHARCLVLDNGETRLAFVVVDSCLIKREIFDQAKRLIHEQTGLPADHILISSTHSHSAAASASIFQSEADPEYIHFLIPRIADGVHRAINNLAPAKIAWGIANETNQVFNRRWKMKPGAVLANPFGGTDEVKMNPPVANPNLLEPAGPTDPGITFLSVQSPEGRPIALLANYSLHYVGGVPDGVISADYYGAFAERITQLISAEHLDPDFVAIMSNGTSGNINNIDFRHPHKQLPPFGQIHLVADAVANEVYSVYKTLQYQDWVPLQMLQSEINLGVRHPSEEEIDRAKTILTKTGDMKDLKTPQEIYARETILLKDYPQHVPLILQTIKIGDLAIVGIPCEVFAETGLAIKEKSPFKPTFTISLANGWNGYLPTPEQHKLGGYETWRARSSYLEVDASTKIFDTVMTSLSHLQSER